MQFASLRLVAMLAFLAACATESARSPAGREFSGLYPIIENGRLGFIDRAGAVVVQPRLELPPLNFLDEDIYAGDLGIARLGDKWGYVDRTGAFVINPQFDAASVFEDDLARVVSNNKVGFVDRRGQYVVNPQFDDALPFSDGLAAVRLGEKWGYIDREGRYAINPQFDGAGDFRDGMAPVRSSSLWGWVDREGTYTINPQFEDVGPFIDGRAVVKAGGKYGIIGRDGRYIVNPQFEFAADSVVENRWRIVLSGKAGYADQEGRIAINPQFDAARDFAEGMAAVRADGRWGFIGPDGTYRINPQFDDVTSFVDGFARFTSGNKVGFINRSGAIVVNPQYDLAGARFRGGRTWVASEGRLGYIDTEGRFIRQLMPVINVSSTAQVDSIVRGAGRLPEPLSGLIYYSIRGNMGQLAPGLLQRAGAPYSNAEIFTEQTGDDGFLTSGAHNYHAVTVPTDGRSRRFFVTSPDFDTYLSVWLIEADGDRRLVGQNDDWSGDLRTSKVETTPEDGVYVLEVRGYTTSHSGRYTVGVESGTTSTTVDTVPFFPPSTD
jgi:hypothetical protein